MLYRFVPQMRQGERKSRHLLAITCALLVTAAVAPAAAHAAPATDEYTLDLPKAEGSEQVGEGAAVPTAPAVPAPTETAPGSSEVSEETAPGNGSEREGDGGAFTTSEPMGRTSVAGSPADPLLDGPMLALLSGLLLITAAGTWRLLRRRRTLPGATG